MSDQPKPTGEWTVERVRELIIKDEWETPYQALTEAINTTLAAERETSNQLRELLDSELKRMEREVVAERERYRKLVGAERRRCFDLEQQLRSQLAARDAFATRVEKDCRNLKNQLASAQAENKFEKTVYATDTTALDAAIDAATYDLKLLKIEEYQECRKQLEASQKYAELLEQGRRDAIAAAQQPLVDGLHKLAMRVLQSDFYLQAKQETDDALLLAKAKEGRS